MSLFLVTALEEPRTRGWDSRRAAVRTSPRRPSASSTRTSNLAGSEPEFGLAPGHALPSTAFDARDDRCHSRTRQVLGRRGTSPRKGAPVGSRKDLASSLLYLNLGHTPCCMSSSLCSLP